MIINHSGIKLKLKNYWNSFSTKITLLISKKIPLEKEISFGINGGSKLVVTDLNNDGKNELLLLQTAGMFKSKLYETIDEIKTYKEKAKQTKVFCLTAMSETGEVLWQLGNPWEGKLPYLCHGHEQIIKTADLNNDGFQEILTFDADNHLLIIDHKGTIIHRIELPNDNFSIVYYIPINKSKNEFILLVGTMDRGYSPHPYANPWLIINNNFEITSIKDYLGAGHNIVFDDINKDGLPELLIGYQLVNINGEVIWTLDYWENKKMDSFEQHADCIQAHWLNEEWYAAISGSDKQYYINSKGQTIWSKRLPHPQFCAIGKYKNENRIFVANQREIMNSLDLKGKEKWSGLLKEYWPYGKPTLLDSKRPIHVTEPLVKIDGISRNDLIIYTEGGWPYIIDFNGNIKFIFGSLDKNNSSMKDSKIFRRINDIGSSFEILNQNNKIYIYNRKACWVYSCKQLNSP